MGLDLPTMIGSMEWRVLVEYDEDYTLWVARCLDTNAVATGETQEEAESLIKEVIENDIRIAVREGSIRNLMHARASYDVYERWFQTKSESPESFRQVALEVPEPESTPKRSVQPELKFITSRRDSSAA